MLSDLIGRIWRSAPSIVRRWITRLSHPRFVVTAGAVIVDHQGRVLLLKHRFRPGAGWGMPGGFLEKDEQPVDALRRELREEAGLEIEKVKLLMTRTYRTPRQLEIVFSCQAVGEAGKLNYEIKESRWFTLEDLPQGLPKDQQQIIRRVLGDGASRED